MNQKYFYLGLGIFVAFVLLVFIIPNYFTGDVTYSSKKLFGEIEKIEVYHFHGTNQCSSCIAVGNLAEETVNTYFLNELKSGKIVFAHVNKDLPENFDLAKKYGATGSSLWIGVVYKDGTFVKEENTNVWYKINNKQDYMNYLKEVINNKFLGE